MKKYIYYLLLIIIVPIYVPIATTTAIIARLVQRNKKGPRLVWGPIPIINNVYWSRAMKNAGFKSETFTVPFYSSISKREDWDILINEKYPCIPYRLKGYIAFIESLLKYDVFFISADGFFLGLTPLWRFEHYLFLIAGKKTVLIPYGSDAFVYRNIRSTSLAHGLMISYPDASKIQNKIKSKLDYWVEHADFVNPGMMGPDGFGRWDLLAPSSLAIDTKQWIQSSKLSKNDGINGPVVIVHAPNHRGFKGTEFILNAVDSLKSEGLKINLVLLEKVQNFEVRNILNNQADILVEQLIAPGHGINALEGLASGIPVVSNLEDDDYLLPFRRWSYLSECPIVSASPETIKEVLRKLIENPSLRHQLGNASREYVEKYQNLEAAEYRFSAIIDFLFKRRDSLINIYHPITGDYTNLKPKITHPLIKNRIVN